MKEEAFDIDTQTKATKREVWKFLPLHKSLEDSAANDSSDQMLFLIIMPLFSFPDFNRALMHQRGKNPHQFHI